jgi:hypothetical protein
MVVIDGKINISIDATHLKSTTTTLESWLFPNMPSGIWVYDPDLGLYNKHTPAYLNDFGRLQGQIYPGVISELYIGGTTVPVYKTNNAVDCVFTGSVYLADNTARYIVNSLVEGANRGWFVTSRFSSPGLKDNWNKLILKYNGIDTASDKILFKYRKDKWQSFTFTQGQITWVNSTTFTTTNTDIVGKEDWEVEITTGNGSGYLAHIVSITNIAGTYTVLLDDTIGGITLGDIGGCIVQNFFRLPINTNLYQIIGPDTDGAKNINLGTKPSKFVQIKCEIRGDQIEIEEFNLINTNQTPSQ